MKLLPCALLGLLVVELLLVAPGFANDSEGQQAAGKSAGKRLKKKVSKSGGQPKIRRTIRVHETSPPLDAVTTTTTTTPEPTTQTQPQPQPQTQAPSLQPNIELSNVGPSNQIEVKPEISISMNPSQDQSQTKNQAQPLQPRLDEDEPKRVKSSTPEEAEAPRSPAAPVQVSQEQNLVQVTPEAMKDEGKEPKRDKLKDVGNSESLELDGVGNQKSTKISNSGNREQVEIEEGGNEVKNDERKKEKSGRRKKIKKKKACKHPDHNGEVVHHDEDHEHFGRDEHEHQGPDCKHHSHKRDKKDGRDKRRKKVEPANIQIHINNNGPAPPPPPTTMSQEEPRLPVGSGARFVVPVIDDAHLSAAVMRGRPQEIQAALAAAQAAPRQFLLVQPTPAGAYLGQPLVLQSPQLPVVAAPPVQVAPQPMWPAQPMMGHPMQVAHPMMAQSMLAQTMVHPPAAMMVPHMMMPSGAVPMVGPAGQLMPMMMAPLGQPTMAQPWPMQQADKKKRKKGKKKGKKSGDKEKRSKDKGEKEEEEEATTTTERPHLDQLVRHPSLQQLRMAERYLPAVSLPSIPGLAQLPPAFVPAESAKKQ